MPRLAAFSACWLVSVLLAYPAAGLEAQDSLGAAAHDSVSQGAALFHGSGGCAECHGANGAGSTEGPSLVAGPWSLGDGTLPWLTHMASHGGWGSRGRDGDPQRMRGPTVLDSTQVRLVAEYVFSISRAKTPCERQPGR